MRQQFIKLYVISALLLISLIVLFGQLYNDVFFPESQRAVMITQSELARVMTSPQTGPMEISTLGLPDTLANTLRQNGQLLLSETTQDNTIQHYLYVVSPDSTNHASQIGPFTLVNEPEGHQWAFVAFYSLLAIALLLVFKPLFDDLRRLQSAVVNFSHSPNNIPVIVNKSSSIYPLAKGLSEMSGKITHFLQLHQDLSRILSHEIRIPLSRIVLAMSFLQPDKSTHSEEQKLIEHALDDIESRLDQYLHYARIENQFAVYQLEEVDIRKLIEKQIAAASAFSHIHISSTCECTSVMAEPNSMAIAIQNMLGNALKYADKNIAIGVSQNNDQITLSVEDDGPGLPNNAQDLLKPFEQGHNQALSSGYGLGLYIIQRIAHWHNGNLEIDNCSSLGGARTQLMWPGTQRSMKTKL